MQSLKLAIITLIVFSFIGCASLSPSVKLELLDRPPPFTDCDYVGVPDGRWCLSDDCYIKETMHRVMLNDTITKYELMVIEYREAHGGRHSN